MMISSRLLADPPSFERAMSEHALILRAVRDRDVTVAEAAMRLHIQDVIVLFRQSNQSPRATRTA
jgi:GntR family transcriptional regulator, rspAB operon transcriptional repressor